jgi:hypothetical protein
MSSLKLLKEKGLLPGVKKAPNDDLQINDFTNIDSVYIKTKNYSFNDLGIKQTPASFPPVSDNTIFWKDNLKLTDLVFFDTETTGLSTGAGSVIFLTGAGFFNKDVFTIKQYFLSKYAYEQKYLTKITDQIDTKILVTYNGKSYDYPLLKSRLVYQNTLNKNSADLIIKEPNIIDHLDLLHHARRFYKDLLLSCSLSSIEESILNIARCDDICGAEIPLVYYDFLESNDLSQLEKVFYHNELDIVNLAKLFFHFISLFKEKNYSEINQHSTSKYYFKQKKFDLAEEILANNLEQTDYQNLKLLAEIYKKKQDYAKAVKIWHELIFNETDTDVSAYEELAKYYEHKVKDYAKALDITNQAMQKIEAARAIKKFVDLNIYDALFSRKKRILNKINKIMQS